MIHLHPIEPVLASPDLWYRKPAEAWTEALPVGNGRLGAMVFGGFVREQLQLNESTFWAGGPYQPINPDALPSLAGVRQLIFTGRYAEAEALANRYLMAAPYLQMSYQPVGDIWIEFEHGSGAIENYRRSLDLDRALATTEYDCLGITYRREVFASAADDVIVMRLSADRPGALAFGITATSLQPGPAESASGNCIERRGTNPGEHGVDGALRFLLRARVLPLDGKLRIDPGRISLMGADSALILVDIGTSFRRFDDVSGDPDTAVDARLAAAEERGFEELRERHVAAHQRLYRRLTVDLGTTAAADLPTDERVVRNAEVDDPALAALYLQYGRYLMISSSRPGTQPANLQGIWNDQPVPPWGSKYTTNINLEMNYWLPNPANLAECVDPLVEMVAELSITGAAMAKAHYGARGWVMHHNTDLWRATGPVDGAKWGLWPTGGAWVCAALWDHYRFTPNPTLLTRLYPVLKGAAEFMLDVLVEEPGTGFLVTNPSLSPENVHPYGASLCAGPTMDNQILRDLFDAVIEAAGLLGADDEFVRQVAKAKARLRPERIGKAGQLQEWGEDWDMDTPEIHHRHISHLYGLYPSNQISIDETPALAAAAQKSLEIRGDEATGWGIGWRLNLWARLAQGDHAHAVLARLLSADRTYPNLFDAHPPFQIDGNFGGAAGIIEMLVQSRPGTIHLLSALPSAWPSGRITGVRARGGFELDLAWHEGMLDFVTLRGTGSATVRCQNLRIEVTLAGGEPKTFRRRGGELILDS